MHLLPLFVCAYALKGAEEIPSLPPFLPSFPPLSLSHDGKQFCREERGTSTLTLSLARHKQFLSCMPLILAISLVRPLLTLLCTLTISLSSLPLSRLLTHEYACAHEGEKIFSPSTPFPHSLLLLHSPFSSAHHART